MLPSALHQSIAALLDMKDRVSITPQLACTIFCPEYAVDNKILAGAGKPCTLLQGLPAPHPGRPAGNPGQR